MKKIINISILMISLSWCGSLLADTVEVGIPIEVDNGAYTIVSKPDYYYYSGHRCYAEKRTDLGVNVLGLHAGVGGGSDIYCYPYP